MGIVEEKWGSDWNHYNSDCAKDYTDTVKAALGGEIPFPPVIGAAAGCDAPIDFGGLITSDMADASLQEAFQVALDSGDPSEFEDNFVTNLYLKTLEAIDAIPEGPFAPPIMDPTKDLPASNFAIDCETLPNLIGCLLLDLPLGLTGAETGCLCEYLNPTVANLVAAGIISSSDSEGMSDSDVTPEQEQEFCDALFALILPILTLPFPPDIPIPDIPLPPDFCSLFAPTLDCNFEVTIEMPSMAFVFNWAIEAAINFIINLPIFVLDILTCLASLDPCEIVTCVSEGIADVFDIESLTDMMGVPVTFLTAMAVYMEKITIYTIGATVGLALGMGLGSDCIMDSLGMGA